MAGVPTTGPEPEPEPDLVLEPPANGPPPAKSNAGILLVLVGILLTLLGILYVAIEYTGVFEPSAAAVQCANLDGTIRLSSTGGRVCDLPPKSSAGEYFGPEDFVVDGWANLPQVSEKERHCRDIDGFVVWSTNGSKICDVEPRTLPGQNFGSEDWFIEHGEFVNPFGS